jgi:hypothetical protein
VLHRPEMSEPFATKLGFILKAFSMSRGRLAADMGVDKSVVGRWVTGAVVPSEHNLMLLTAQFARRAPGFTSLSWERDLAGLAELLGADTGVAPPPAILANPGLPLAILDQIRATTALRGAAYEGFFRSTRPYVLQPGRFLHDYGMIRLDETGLLSLRMGTGGHMAEGWMLPVHNQLFCIAADVTSGALLFGIFNGVATARAEVIDGLSLGSALDGGRTPTAHAMIFERIGDLSGDSAADDARFGALAAGNPLAPQGEISDHMREHLTGDFGPIQLALGGALLLQMALSRSLSRGTAFGE